MLTGVRADVGRLDAASEISPRTTRAPDAPSDTSSNMASIAPWEFAGSTAPGDYQRDLGSVGSTNSHLPSFTSQAATSFPYTQNWNSGVGRPDTAQSGWGGYSDNSTDDVTRLPPGFRPYSGRIDSADDTFPTDYRRPSVASANTVSSSGSRSTGPRGFHKKLQGFFGDEVQSAGSRKNSETSLPTNATSELSQATRGSSFSNHYNVSDRPSQPTSPTTSRPRTPQPSSEVTPWMFQDSEVSTRLG